MPSLYTDAGTWSPKCFHTEALDYGPIRRRRYNSGVLVEDLPNLAVGHRHLVYDVYRGKVLDDFHRRKNAGELLPYTQYRKVTSSTEVLGPSTLAAGPDASNRFEWTWTDGKNWVPLRYLTLHDPYVYGSNYVLTTLGINPWVFPQAAAAKLYMRGWDALTFLAELSKTVTMFRKAVREGLYLIGAAYDAIVKRNARATETLVRMTMDDWLQARYGWRVLMYDLRDISKALNEFDEKQRLRNKERVGSNWTHTKLSNFVAPGAHQVMHFDSTEYDINIRGSIIADFIPDRLISNPLLTTWELVPYSFVIDWFLSVGTALSALSFLTVTDKYTSCLGYSISASRTATTSVDFTGTWAAAGWSNWHEIVVKQSWTEYVRKPCMISTLPSLRVNLDTLKVVDLIALIGQLLRRLAS